jgi:kumamolisin
MRRAILFSVAIVLVLGNVMAAPAQEPSLAHKGRVVIPDSAIERAEDVGVRAHTPYRIFVPADRVQRGGEPNGLALPDVVAPAGPPFTGYAFETPASLACIYGLVTAVAGCNPNTFKTNPSGGSKAIGIVDAFDYPTAMTDLNKFSAQFGLPAVTSANFKVVFAGGTGGCAGSDPGNDPGWEGEQALDIEMAHAMAPSAKIFLVEAASNSFSDLMVAEDCATKLVAAAGGGEISNSWGGSEYPTERPMTPISSKRESFTLLPPAIRREPSGPAFRLTWWRSEARPCGGSTAGPRSRTSLPRLHGKTEAEA